MDYHFETVQNLKLGVYDIDNSSSDLGDDDYLGGVELTLGQVHTHQKNLPNSEEMCVLFCFFYLVQMGVKFRFSKINFYFEILNLTNIQLNFDSVSVYFFLFLYYHRK